MVMEFPCSSCGRHLRGKEQFAGKRAECPYCGGVLEVPPSLQEVVEAELVAPPPGTETAAIQQYFDPPSVAMHADRSGTAPSLRRMFEALLDPRSIQWMLILGGGLSVLGMIVWLTSLGVFQNRLLLAIALGLGSLAILGAGWWISLRLRFQIAGQSLTFLGCIVAPLNLWYYAHFDLEQITSRQGVFRILNWR